MKRPEAEVLPESAVVPERAVVHPPPNRFTHTVRVAQPYHYAGAAPADPPAGTLPAGTRVVLLTHAGGADCHVVDARGLHVVTAFAGLDPIP